MPVAANIPRLAIALAVCLVPSLAHADEGAGRPTLDVAAYGSLLSISSRTFRTDYGAAAHAHLFPWLRVGLRFARGTEFVPFEDPGERTVGFTALDFLAHAEGHARPAKAVDPYVGLGLGALLSWQGRSEPGTPSSGGNRIVGSDPPDGKCRVDARCWAPLATLALGLDFHVHRHIAFGPYVEGRAPIATVGGGYPPQSLMGTLLPALRVMVIF